MNAWNSISIKMRIISKRSIILFFGIMLLVQCSIFKRTPSNFTNDYFLSDLSKLEKVNAHFDILHHQWGGANGGVSKENVFIRDGKIICRANGDLYEGSIQGVDRNSKPKFHTDRTDPKFGKPWTNRVGGCFMFNKKTGYGSYRVIAKLPTQLGVASAFWTFFYNEIYPSHPDYEKFKQEGLHEQGDKKRGFYIVRNHEIDIEFPSHLEGEKLYKPSLSNVKLNVWRGELKNNKVQKDAEEYWEEFQTGLTPVGKNMGDGQFHEFRFDWYANRVEYYIDGVLLRIHKNGEKGKSIPDIAGYFTMGLWFPSSPLLEKPWLVNPKRAWAGGIIGSDGGMKANFESVEMEISRFEFIPFKKEKRIRVLQETYQPNVKGQFVSEQ